MKRAALIVALMCVAPTVFAQDLKTLADQVARMQLQINALEKKLAEVQIKTSSMAGFTVSGGTFVLNAGAAPVTIRAGSILLESTGAMDLRAGTSFAVDSGAVLNLKAVGSATFEGGGILSLRGSLLKLNNGGRPALAAGDQIAGTSLAPQQSTVFVP